MKEFIILLIVVAVIQAIYFMAKFFTRKMTSGLVNNNRAKLKSNTVIIPLSYRIIMIAVAVVFALVGVFCCLFPEDPSFDVMVFTIVFFSMIALFLLGVFIFWSLWRIRFDDRGFEYRNYFGVKRRYLFNEVELYEHPKGSRWSFYKSRKKVVSFTYINKNYDMLLSAYDMSKKDKLQDK